MNNNVKGILVVGGLAVIGYIAYKKIYDNPIKVVARHRHMSDLTVPYQEHYNIIKGFYNDNPDYIKNRAKALKKKQPYYTFNGKTFLTSTGILK
jgi:hypothetical protein